ncbi:glycerol-3-phosphate dehydrogenase/oxidase [Erwinia typographi]|uniref:glycerol-3-phosphate dehydrogenase/oxidase n=1 Tax=Erwinia typographi TaxID=371042 RepID=UPI00068D0F7D|nr:glycerol-3-phosphate dehydrogenase/oxidase [Erwinia typographi]
MASESSRSDDREARLARLRQIPRTPVLIVGGGINGISTFRELALQGIPVVMVEKGDWCQAASGALSRMIHGGLRYLETGEFSLVKESVRERDRLLKNAPHYVAPLRTTVPIDSWGGGLLNAGKRFLRLTEKPSRRGALVIKTGLTLYDAWSRRFGNMPKHQLHNQPQTRQRWPGFADWVKCSAAYYDAWIAAPERLGFELIEDAERAEPAALALNYLSVEQCDGEKITLRDTLRGETFSLKAHVVVNATGAWIDRLNGTLSESLPERKLIGGTKGSHLILHCPALLQMLDGEMVYYENQEGRVCIMFPWYGNVLVGSTDIRVDNPDDVVCEKDEQSYILDSLRFVFPHLTIKEEDVLYTFSGVRPLPASHAASNGSISRNHSLVLLPPLAGRDFTTLCLVGGKWTTFRQFGEEAADRVLKLLGEQRKVSTADLAIGGGRDFPSATRKPGWLKALSSEYGVSQTRVSQLVSRYGTRAQAVMNFMRLQPDHPLHAQPDWSQNELRFLIRHEQVQTLEDLLVRRTPLAISGQLTLPLMAEVNALLAEDRGWSPEKSAQHLTDTLSRLAALHGLGRLYPVEMNKESCHVSQSESEA